MMTLDPTRSDDAAPTARAKVLRDLHYQKITILIDRLFVALLAAQWAFAVVLAVVLSPRTWVGSTGSIHPLRNQIRALDLAPRGKPVIVTASFGVAEVIDLASRGGELRASALVSATDGALYAAKRDGRDCVRLHQGGVRDTLAPPRDSLFPVRDTRSPPRDSASPRRDSTIPRRESRIVITAA